MWHGGAPFREFVRASAELNKGSVEMLDREQLETFATVAETRSFERAATQLSITRSAVSQRIKALEETLAVVLLLREKPIGPTPPGEVLLRYVKALRLLEGEMMRELVPTASAQAPVPLAIAVNADSLATWFIEPLWLLLRERQVALEIITDDQAHTTDRLARGEVVGCIATEAQPATGFQAEPLGAMEYRCYATPSFAKGFLPDGLTLPAVLAAPAILFNRKDSLHDDFLQDIFGFKVGRYPRHYLPSPSALLEGIRAGIGYGLAPALQAAALAERGELIDLAPHAPVRVELYWHYWGLEPPLAHHITAHVVEQAHQRLLPASNLPAMKPKALDPPAAST